MFKGCILYFMYIDHHRSYQWPNQYPIIEQELVKFILMCIAQVISCNTDPTDWELITKAMYWLHWRIAAQHIGYYYNYWLILSFMQEVLFAWNATSFIALSVFYKKLKEKKNPNLKRYLFYEYYKNLKSINQMHFFTQNRKY